MDRMPTPLLAGPFTTATARACGVTDGQLRGKRFVRVFTNVHVLGHTVVTPEVQAAAALLLAPAGSIAARHTAAHLWGGVVPHSPCVHLVVPSGHRMRVAGIDARERTAATVVQRRGLRVTAPAATFCDLAEDLGLVDLVVLGDSLVRRGAVSVDRLVAAAKAFGGPRARLARRAASYVRPGVDSPMESRVRMLLVLAGLPEPTVNVVLRDVDGHWRFRLDLAFPQWKLAVEYDGRQHAESTDQWVRDVGRREWFDGHGWRLVVLLSGDVYAHPRATLERVVEAIRASGGQAAVTSSEWRAYFPGRD